MNFKFKIRRFFRNFEISNIMTYVAITMAIIFLGDLLTDGLFMQYLSFNRAAILDGQIWRVITFLFFPQTTKIIWIAISIYFYHIIGKEIENGWGSHNLTMYLMAGALMLIVIGFATGYASCHYLYFSLFLVYAYLNPKTIIRIFAIVPIEARWIALIDIVYMLYAFVRAFVFYSVGLVNYGLGVQLSVLAAFAAFAIFFGKDFCMRHINSRRHKDFLKQMKSRDRDDDDE